MKNYKITTKKTTSGHFKVIVFDVKEWVEIGSFNTTDPQLIDDIEDMDNLTMFDNVDELKEYCINLIK